MKHHAYLFQAKGIQRYILEGGKLKDMVGASELVASLCRSDEQDLLQKVLDATGFKPSGISRRAGGVFMLHYDGSQKEAFKRFRALWRLAVQLAVPGVEITESCGVGNTFQDARDNARENQSGLRENSPAHLLPMAGPLAQRAQRTGGAAVPAEREEKGADQDEELDTITKAKRQMELRLRKGEIPGNGVAGRFEPNPNDFPKPENGWQWPVELEEEKPGEDEASGKDPSDKRYKFPFKGGKRWVGVVHADISGLGQLFRKVDERLKGSGDDPNKLAAECSRRSKAVEKAVEDAARWATGQVLAGPAIEEGKGKGKVPGLMPARPIVLGGDDVTIIVRADLAIPFARAFLEKLEKAPPIEGHMLTACAGIAFLKANQPFYMAHRLAEDLCKYAKAKVKENLEPGADVPSAIAFHRITTSMIDEYDDIVKNGLTTPRGYVLTRQPYLVGDFPKPGLAKLADLEKLKKWISQGDVSIGPLRNLESLLSTDFDAAKKGYLRWRQSMRAKQAGTSGAVQPGTSKTLEDEFKVLMKPLVNGGLLEELPFGEDDRTSSLFDALDWREVEPGAERDAGEDEKRDAA